MSTAVKSRRRLDQQNPAGRVDVAIARVIREVAISQTENPIAQIVYKALWPELEAALQKNLGPDSKKARELKRNVRKAAKLRRELGRRLAEEL